MLFHLDIINIFIKFLPFYLQQWQSWMPKMAIYNTWEAECQIWQYITLGPTKVFNVVLRVFGAKENWFSTQKSRAKLLVPCFWKQSEAKLLKPKPNFHKVIAKSYRSMPANRRLKRFPHLDQGWILCQKIEFWAPQP